MKTSKTVVWLSMLISVLALVATSIGLFWQDGGEPFSFTTLRGQTVRMYGRGLYRHDTLFLGAGNRGFGTVTLVLGIPLLLFSAWLYRRGSLRGGLLLTGTLTYFLYVYASMALGVAYNPLFLVYVALFSASFFALVRAFTSIDHQALSSHVSPGMPRRGLALFMFASGLVTLVVWLLPLLGPLLQGQPPTLLDSYTTPVTYALDLALIMPTTFLSGVPFSTGEIVGPIAGLSVLSLTAIGFMAAILRNVSE